MKITIETTIDAPPATVFATMVDIPHWPQFMSAVEEVKLLDPEPIAVGSRFREMRIMGGDKFIEDVTVVAVEPPRRFGLTMEIKGTRYLAMHDVAAAGTGARVTLAFEGTPLTRLASLIGRLAFLFAGDTRRYLEIDLADLKAEAERRAKA